MTRPIRSSAVLLTLLLLVGTASVAAENDSRYDAERQAIEVLAGGCAGCHGTDGRLQGRVPSIAGQPAELLETRLLQYRNNEGSATVMNRIAGGYTEEELARLAQHFSEIDR